MSNLFDAFISYGRPDSLDFAKKLHKHLTKQGKKVWLDLEDIDSAEPFPKTIEDGIVKSHNFIFIISPHSVNSYFCSLEIKLAIKYNKRIIPLLHVEKISQKTWQQRNPDGTDEEWTKFKQEGKHNHETNMHRKIRYIQWIDFQKNKYTFKSSLDDLIATMNKHNAYVKQHTIYLVQARKWINNKKQTKYLLIEDNRIKAEKWLTRRFENEQPPCLPTDCHGEYICASTKNAHNLLTDVFICYSEECKNLKNKIAKNLRREGITIWEHNDINTGSYLLPEIQKGIEGADNFIYLISPDSIQSPNCQQQLKLALAYKKRIIPLVVKTTPNEILPNNLQKLKSIDFTEYTTPHKYQPNVVELLQTLRQDKEYYRVHKVLLVKALKWLGDRNNHSLLLRGSNLNYYENWLKTAKARLGNPHPPLETIHCKFIQASSEQPNQSMLDIFICYSPANSDIARKINEGLQELGKTTWFDQESLIPGVDVSGGNFEQAIKQGIASCNNFVFIISPQSVISEDCAKEIEYAEQLKKRFIPVLYGKVLAQDLHSALREIYWIDFIKHRGDFSVNFNELVRAIDRDREYVINHNKWLQRALEWQSREKDPDLLLRGSELVFALDWLKKTKKKNKYPQATDLQNEYIKASEIEEQQRRERELELERKAQQGEILNTIANLLEKAEKAQRLLSIKPLQGLIMAKEAVEESHNKLDRVLPALQSSLYDAINVARESNRFSGHLHEVRTVQFSPNGQYIASGGGDGTIIIWNKEGKQLGRVLQGHKEWVNSLQFSPDGRYIVSGSGDGTIRIWDWNKEDNQLYKSLPVHKVRVNSVQFSPDGQYIVSGSRDTTIRIWDINNNCIVRCLNGHQENIYSVQFSPNGQYIVSGGGDGSIRIWDRQGNLIGEAINGHQDSVYSVQFSPDGQYIVSGSRDKTIKIWDKEGNFIRKTSIDHDRGVISVAFSRDGEYIVSGSYDRTIRIWDKKGNPIGKPMIGHQASVNSVQFSPDGEYIVSGSRDKTIRIWDTKDIFIGKSMIGHEHWVRSVAFSHDGEYIVSGSRDTTIRIWNKKGLPVGDPIKGHQNWVRSVAFSPDGKYIVSGSRDTTIRIWDREGNSIGNPLNGHQGNINSVQFSSNGQYIISGSGDGTIRIWDKHGLPLSNPLICGQGNINSVQFSPDGEYIVSGSGDGTIRLWDKLGLPFTKPLIGHEGSVYSVQFSPDGEYIVSGSGDGTIRLWDKHGRSIGEPMIGHEDSVYSVQFSRDGKYIVSGSGDGTIRLWDREGNSIGTPLTGHTQAVTSVAFSPNGQYIVSGSWDKTIRIWRGGNWQSWLEIARNRLRHHPALSELHTRQLSLFDLIT